MLSGYSALSQRAGRFVAPHSRPLLERFAGALLIAAGAGLAAIGREVVYPRGETLARCGLGWFDG